MPEFLEISRFSVLTFGFAVSGLYRIVSPEWNGSEVRGG